MLNKDVNKITEDDLDKIESLTISRDVRSIAPLKNINRPFEICLYEKDVDYLEVIKNKENIF